MVENDIIITLGSKQDIENANEIGKKLKKKIRAYLEIDTKVGTSGFIYNNREELIIALKSSENIKIEGTFSKLKDSLNDDKYTKIQFQRFIDVIEILKMNQIETGILNICDETAFFRFSTMNLNAIRIEKAFLGENISARNIINLRKPITLETKISEIKKLPKGAYIGNLKTKKEITICIIPYLCKNEIKQKSIIINNQQCKILGNIDNNIICDITKKDIKIGQKIVLPIENSSNVNIEVRREYR